MSIGISRCNLSNRIVGFFDYICSFHIVRLNPVVLTTSYVSLLANPHYEATMGRDDNLKLPKSIEATIKRLLVALSTFNVSVFKLLEVLLMGTDNNTKSEQPIVL